MSKYLKLFETTSEYEAYINGGGVILPNVSFCEDERGVYYNPYVPHDYSQDYFTMVVTTGGGNVTWTGKSGNALSYSTNNGTTWSTPSSNITLTVEADDKVLWKGTTTPSSSGIGTFSGGTDVRYSVEGNTMSLLYGDDFKGQTSLAGKNYAFYQLFYNNKNITSAENLSLPATTLATYCYNSMFKDCTSLTTAPELPATTLVSNCYANMFYNCTNLTTAPELPATTLNIYCYSSMFRSCTSLITAPELPATTLVSNCYANMFYNCTNLTTAPSVLPATTLANYCYSSMFHGCTSLTVAPELPDSTLAKSCYSYMFDGCTSLNSIKCLVTNISATDYTYDWVHGVAASGTFTKKTSMTSWTEGTNGIPNGWTVQDAD